MKRRRNQIGRRWPRCSTIFIRCVSMDSIRMPWYLIWTRPGFQQRRSTQRIRCPYCWHSSNLFPTNRRKACNAYCMHIEKRGWCSSSVHLTNFLKRRNHGNNSWIAWYPILLSAIRIHDKQHVWLAGVRVHSLCEHDKKESIPTCSSDLWCSPFTS